MWSPLIKNKEKYSNQHNEKRKKFLVTLSVHQEIWMLINKMTIIYLGRSESLCEMVSNGLGRLIDYDS